MFIPGFKHSLIYSNELARLPRLVLFLLLSLVLPTTMAQEAPAQAAPATQVLKIALLDSYPWSFDKKGEIEGIYPSMLRKVEAELGAFRIDIQLNPMARTLHDIQEGELDLAIMSYRPARAEMMKPFIPLYKTPFVVLSHKDSAINTFADFQGKSIAMLWGGSGCPCLGDLINYRRVKVNSHEQSMKMLIGMRVDGISGPAIRLFGQVDNQGVGEQIAPALVYEWRDVWLWTGKGASRNKKAIEMFAAEFKKLLAAGMLKTAASNYLSAGQLKFMHDPEAY